MMESEPERAPHRRRLSCLFLHDRVPLEHPGNLKFKGLQCIYAQTSEPLFVRAGYRQGLADRCTGRAGSGGILESKARREGKRALLLVSIQQTLLVHSQLERCWKGNVVAVEGGGGNSSVRWNVRAPTCSTRREHRCDAVPIYAPGPRFPRCRRWSSVSENFQPPTAPKGLGRHGEHGLCAAHLLYESGLQKLSGDWWRQQRRSERPEARAARNSG